MVSVVSTFAGRGGSSLGYKMAKCKVLLAIDFEANAVKTYKLNFPNTIVWKSDIREITGKQILNEIKLKKGELDIFDGSPPCTPFSISGKREKGWGKKYKHGTESKSQTTDDLFFEYIRLLKELMPKSFIAENVRGLIQGTSKGYFNKILVEFKKSGYDVKVFDINAKDFDVPQSRPRIIFIGVRKDLKAKFPILKTHKEITFAQAVKNLKIPKNDLVESIKAVNRPCINKYLRYVSPGQNFQRYHPNDSQFNFMRIRNDRPCNTIRARSHHQIFHPTENRSLTVAEAKRCSTFPDDYKFLSFSDAWTGIGNSVPPKLSMHIANYVKRII